MLFWFAGLSFALVMLVFDSPALDYRLVMLGSLLPWIDFIWGPPWVLHSVFLGVVVMGVVMIVFRGRRLVQRRWLGLVIGLFTHLILAATWTSAEVFWWPAFGLDIDGIRPPVAPIGLLLVLEAAGLVVAAWLWRRLGLVRPDRRELLVRTGRVDRAALGR